ncbi:MAG: protein-disulfide reductase DsbD family protein, partial [Proteobacteria bacterium]|nr:protein-disulfide reductase DsbD family protein [Pseudomonadota bacterium]
ATAWAETDQTAVRIVSATQSIGDKKELLLGLEFKLKPGWKIYWRSPGDAGFPPRVQWDKSSNIGKVDVAWPTPGRFSVLGFETTGYKKAVVFPMTTRGAEPGKPVQLRAKLSYLTCDDVCIPYSANFTLDIPAGKGEASDHFQVISKYLSQVPGDGSTHGLKIEKAELAGALTPAPNDLKKGFLRVVASSATPFAAPDVFIEGPEEAGWGKPDVTLRNGGKEAVLRVAVTVDKDVPLVGKNLRLTLTDGNRSAEQAFPLALGDAGSIASVGGSAEGISYVAILLLALLGGLILNLMPCVLPVLSLKLLGVVSSGGKKSSEVRASFLASAAGIIFTFLVIASALIGLKLAGGAVGWGIQFQHPWFLVSLTLLVSLFAFNLFGIFEIRLPGSLANFAGTAGGGDSLGGNFATGAFATVLATPCSAPFLGTAVGFALVGSFVDTYAVFAALGVGMAVPFLLVAAVPSLATRLPKPGPWMIRLKQILGIALALTALWLVSVLAIQVSIPAAVVIGLLMVAIGLILAFRNRLPETRRWAAAAAGVVVIALASFAVPSQFRAADTGPQVAQGHWQPFDPDAIPKLVAEGKTVFVDVTAEWCITCQVNKAAVLNRGQIFDLLSGGGNVVAMKADWTRPDPVITAYLASFGKFGIPFNAIYGPGDAKPVVLPELLTAGRVLDAFEQAGGGSIIVKK